jgi:hypothetical protein
MKTLVRILLLAGITVTLTGCVGYDSTLFMTKSNFGLDIDTKPPTAEITVSRREGVIAPSFEEGKTPPVMASFKVQQSGLTTFFTGVGQTFAGGDSAVALATLYDAGTPGKTEGATPTELSVAKVKAATNYNSELTLNEEPEYKILFFKKKKFPKSSRVRPFIFGTDTALGVKVAWSGLTAQMPDTARVGFQRKEFALAPVNLTKTETAAGTPDEYSVKMPSFLATVDANVTIGAPKNSGIRSIQFFATGVAATQLALEKDVRKAMLYDADPTAAAKAAAFDGAAAELNEAREDGKTAAQEAAKLIDAASKAELQNLTNIAAKDTIGLISKDDATNVNKGLVDPNLTAENEAKIRSFLKEVTDQETPEKVAQVEAFLVEAKKPMAVQ